MKLVLQIVLAISTLFAFSKPTTIKIGVLLMTSAPEPFDLRRTAPALTIAFEVAQRDLGITFDVIYHNYTGFCPKETVIGHLSELYYRDRVQALIGPACSSTIVAAGRLAQYLRLPMVTGLGDLVVRDEADADMYTSLTILSYNLRKLSLSLDAVLAAYDWRHTAILYDQTYVFFDLAGSNLVSDFRNNPRLPRPYDVGFIPQKVQDFGTILKDAQTYARVYIIFCDSDLLRVILARADELGMTNGDYVFITMELFPSDWLGYYTQFLRGDGKDEAVTRAYESLLILTLKQPNSPEYYVFAEEVKRRAKSQYNYEFGPDEKVNYFITAFYDSALYLAMSYRKCLDDGDDINDGLLVAQKLWNSSFVGITGTVAVDKLGNRIADFDLLDMKSPTDREFQLVGSFSGWTQIYSTVPGTEIVWPYGIPQDKPPCGFRGEDCTVEPGNETVVVVAATVTSLTVCLAVAVLAYFIIRKMQLENDIARNAWLVKEEDIQLRKGRINDSFLSRSAVSVASLAKNSFTASFGAGDGQIFATTGICKGQTVVIRKLHLQSFELTRALKLEFREMTKLFHPNLTKFVGACLSPSNTTILFEYCTRGSLQDMLQNDSIELDWNFRYSIIQDIIKGMTYIHGSGIRCHGRLASTNCVIDSNFSLKLTDYGLHSLFTKERTEERKMSNPNIFNQGKLLWTAPEHLKSSDGSVGFSQPGDVYSFGIILQEIATRTGPFEDNGLTIDELMKQLRTGGDGGDGGVVRPAVPTDACSRELQVMMRQCWMQAAPDRPSFKEIQDAFKKMRAGKTTNIMDNLLQRMSQYADNLESLAAERTKAYLEEKQKAEELLHRLLPPTVAKQLAGGCGVKPESYDSVTIYFSDIVGFTTLAAASTPIEVVSLLNDLYTAFDNKIQKFDVYKVETIGDAYMVVSGLPDRNGNHHVKEICDMALGIVALVKCFKIRHMPAEQLRIRVGVHSGPVVAGVVGLTMPRYCLFGDTVNTASRMESTSEALKIHMSQPAKSLLQKFPGYTIQERGEVTVKGKGNMTTYWLEEGRDREPVLDSL